jgi:hypothetical protein
MSISDFVDPLDTGERYVIEKLSGMLAGAVDRYMIVDRNTFKPMRGSKQPDNRSKFIWKGPRDVAEAMCRALNERDRPRAMDPGTGPEVAARSVSADVLRWAKAPTPAAYRPQAFVQCGECGRCHRLGKCP